MADIEQEGVSPATSGGASAPERYRQGNHNGGHVYDGNTEIGFGFTPELGERIVKGLNLLEAHEAGLDPRDAEIERLRGELAEIRAKLAEVHDAAQYDDITTLRAVEMLAEQRNSMMTGWGRCHEKHIAQRDEAAELQPRRWAAGDPEPEVGTTVRQAPGEATYTRRSQDGRWHLNTCGRNPEECSGGGFEWPVISAVPLVEVVSTNG